ncbi:MAG: hypothetical protein GY827_01335 [Cytophagales bacterium]|nr:hypothetical protein [Cytophagales bacterium]
MFFILSKTLHFLAKPIIWMTILLLMAFFTRKDKRRKKLLSYVLIIFFIFSNPLGMTMVFKLWEKKPVPLEEVKEYDIGIVLSGVVQISQKPHDRVFFAKGADRLLHTVDLYKRGKIKKVLITGGDNSLIEKRRSEALLLAQSFEMCGVKKEDIIVEENSRNTYENAVESCKIIKEKYPNSSFLLITSAFHMRRAEACFRKQGLIFDSFPVDYYTSGISYSPKGFIPSVGAMSHWDLILHEWLGYVSYLTFGKSSWSLPENTIGRKADEIVEPQIEIGQSTVFTDSTFTGGIEGPAVDSLGDLYVVNYQKQGTIGKVDTQTGKVELFVELPNGSIGNGIRFDKKGNLLVADYINHNVLYIEKSTKKISVYAHHDSLNQPNDIAIMDNGILFASDPNWKEGTGNLWRVDTTGTFVLLEDSMGTTNGVEVNPANNKLYVNESIQKKVWSYDLNEKGEISNKQLFHEFPDGGMDGMRCDEKGNLYIARYDKGEIAVLSPQGEVIQKITLQGAKPTNIAFGGKEGKTCYVTMQGKKWIETFKAGYKGRSR